MSSQLHRCPQPSLPDPQPQMSPTGLFERSYSVGAGRLLRAWLDQPLPIRITLNDDNPDARFHLFTDLDRQPDETWHAIPLERLAPCRYGIDLTFQRCGRFHFRLRYSPDGGHTWLWDRAPETTLLIDPPAVRDLRLYSLVTTCAGHLGQWRERLPRLRAMGFNAVHLLPVTQLDVSESPYGAHDLFAVDPSYADPSDSRPPLDQFESFVEAAKAEGIALCMDLVLNHVGIGSKVRHARPDWLVAEPEEFDGIRRAGWRGPDGWHFWRDLALLNFAHPDAHTRADLWQYMRDYARFWANYADYTGGLIRLDNLHSSHEPFMHWLLTDLRQKYPGLPILAELFTDQATNERLVRDYQLNLILGTPWEHHFVPELRNYLRYIHDQGDRVRYYFPISTHDSGTPTEEFGDVRSTAPRYAISCFFSHGITGMTQGVESGNPRKLDFIGRGSKPEPPAKADYTDLIASYHALLDQEPLFRRAGNLRFIDQNHHAILGAWRFDPADPEADGILLLVSLDILGSQSIAIDLQRQKLPLLGRTLRDLLTGKTCEPTTSTFKVTLPPCGVLLLKPAQHRR